MRDYWLTQYILNAIGWGYLITVLIVVALVLWLVKGKTVKIVSLLVVLGLASILPLQGYKEYAKEKNAEAAYRVRLAKARALFDERCKTAGEKIYRTVDEVEGIELINPRPQQRQGIDERDQNWVGAGLPGESTGSQYVLNFLFYDLPANGQATRYLSPGGTAGAHEPIAAGIAQKGTKGYRYVEIEENGSRIEYSLRPLSEYDLGNGSLGGYGKQTIATQPKPKHAVVYENIADPEGRENWIAGARVKVIDKQSGELMAELVQYGFEAGFGSEAGARQPWAFAQMCAASDQTSRPIGTVRYFVAKVLKPTKGM